MLGAARMPQIVCHVFKELILKELGHFVCRR